MKKKASYILSSYSFLSTHSLDDLLNVGYDDRYGKPIPSFDEKTLIDLCDEVTEVLEQESNVIEIEGDYVIVGDIHGSFHDLLRVLNFIFESNMKALFLGDYVDRGQFSLECITLLYALKVMYPTTIYLLRGNHEFDSICSIYGFKNEILNDEYINPNCYKYTEDLYNSFIKSFSYLPLAAIVNKSTFCIHGGLSPNFEFIDDINLKIKRPINSFEENKLLTDLLWSDPTSWSCCSENPRGYGYLFNREIVFDFLKKNSIKRLIRAHQCVKNGCKSIFDDACITVFSVSSYAKFLGNDSSVIKIFNNNDCVEVSSFLPLRHLQKNEAFFYKVKKPLDQIVDNNTNYFSLIHPVLQNKMHPCISQNVYKNQIVKPVQIKNAKSAKLPIAKPKFITNSRNSYPYLKNSVIIVNPSLQKCNFEDLIIKNDKIEN